METAGKQNNYLYNKRLKSKARENRKNLTKAAAALWKYGLKNGNIRGYMFRRERLIFRYIADFVCLDLLLIIEVDGISHNHEKQVEKDKHRDECLLRLGFTTLRFTNWEVLNQMNEVLAVINDWVEKKEEDKS